MKGRRQVQRDEARFDTTSLSADHHGRHLHRDYSAHFFRWSFARRFIRVTDHVLEIGCGPEKPLAKLLLKNANQACASYVGVDLNPLAPGGAGSRATFHGDVDFTTEWPTLRRPGGYDVLVHLEVIEHMPVVWGQRLLRGCYELLRPGGVMLMSTPCYDGHRHAANHVHEYTIDELRLLVLNAGFDVERRFGTFMDVRQLTRRAHLGPELAAAVKLVKDELGDYYDRDALSCFFAPLFPDQARNNLWVCRKPEGGPRG